MNNLAGIVTRVNYLGSVINVGVRAGDLSLTITTPRGERIPVEGEPIVAYWPPSAGILLPEAP